MAAFKLRLYQADIILRTSGAEHRLPIFREFFFLLSRHTFKLFPLIVDN